MSYLAQSQMAEAQQWQKFWYQSVRERSFNIGHKVLVLLPSDDNKPLAKWQGSFESLKKLSPTTYQISTPGRPRSCRVLHINLLLVQRPESKTEVMLIRRVLEEEEVDEQYLHPSGALLDCDLSHLSEDKQLHV